MKPAIFHAIRNTTPEAVIQKQILAALPLLGVHAWRTQSGTRGGGRMHLAPTGTPDICGYRLSDARAVFIEVKRQGGKIRPEQLAFIERAKAAGALAGFATSVSEAMAIIQGSVI